MIVSGIQCPRCEEKLWSKWQHDFHYCGCGYCFVDGGREYLRYGWGLESTKLSEDMTAEDWAELTEANRRVGVPAQIEFEVAE